MSDEKFFYSKSGLIPYPDGSGFKITVTIEQETEDSDPTISLDAVWRISGSEWIAASRRIEHLLDGIRVGQMKDH